MTHKIAVVFGTRPEAIKLAPIVLGLRDHSRLECRVCVTAQHRQMLDQVLTVFGIVPDVDLDLMRPNQNLAELTGRAIQELYAAFLREKPDLVLVQGDTTTVFCASLAAFYARIPVGHVEAGLRTGNLQSPWPEEANRVLTSRLAALHFAPTVQARDNLLKEGVPAAAVAVTGNTVIDALLHTLAVIEPPPLAVLQELGDCAGLDARARVVLITGHRRESFGAGFARICQSIRTLAHRFPDVHFVYPVHLNPNVREPVERILKADGQPNVHLIEPLSYAAFVCLMNRAHVILTDSGGIQEEAPSLGKPVLVMRDTTERPEAIAAGSAILVGTAEDRIVGEVSRLLIDANAYEAMSHVKNPYGDGQAARRIIEVCESFLAGGSGGEATPI
jgi:UDP-N-acetylglucosamine 2-epimerase (non-hydrolysing)